MGGTGGTTALAPFAESAPSFRQKPNRAQRRKQLHDFHKKNGTRGKRKRHWRQRTNEIIAAEKSNDDGWKVAESSVVVAYEPRPLGGDREGETPDTSLVRLPADSGDSGEHLGRGEPDSDRSDGSSCSDLSSGDSETDDGNHGRCNAPSGGERRSD